MNKIHLDIISHNIPFTIQIVPIGESYGNNNKLINNSSEPLVEFYDNRYMHTSLGQFIERYNFNTMRESTEGLCLNPSIENWYIDKKEMNIVRAWLHIYAKENNIAFVPFNNKIDFSGIEKILNQKKY